MRKHRQGFGRAPQEYGDLPPAELPSSPRNPGEITKAPSILQSVCGWMAEAFGLLVSEVPGKLLYPGIQPVAEVYRGRMRIIPLRSADVVGNDFRLPAGVEWEWVALSFSFTTSAAAANRDVELVVAQLLGSGASNLIYRARANVAQAASQSAGYIFAAHGIVSTAFPPLGVLYVPMPIGFTIPAGTPAHPFSFNLNVSGLQAGDVVNSIVLLVRERVAASVIEPSK